MYRPSVAKGYTATETITGGDQMFASTIGPFKSSDPDHYDISLGNNTYVTYVCGLCGCKPSPKVREHRNLFRIIQFHEISHVKGFVMSGGYWSCIRLNMKNDDGTMTLEYDFGVDDVIEILPQIIFIIPSSITEFANNLSNIMRRHRIIYGTTKAGVLNSCYLNETQKYGGWEDYKHDVRNLVNTTQYSCCRCGKYYDAGMPSREMVQSHFIVCWRTVKI